MQIRLWRPWGIQRGSLCMLKGHLSIILEEHNLLNNKKNAPKQALFNWQVSKS